MTLSQFIEALIGMGYKLRVDGVYSRYIKRNKVITIQAWETYTNVFYSKDIKNGSYELNQHRVVDFKKALNNIKRYERKLGL